MIGAPRFSLRTRADYDLLQSQALQGSLRPGDLATLRRHWQGLLAHRWVYVHDRDLSNGEDADGGRPDYLVLDVEEDDGTTRRVQMRQIENPDAEIFRLGFTVQDVEQALTELESL